MMPALNQSWISRRNEADRNLRMAATRYAEASLRYGNGEGTPQDLENAAANLRDAGVAFARIAKLDGRT